jgi:hypothetical protein
MYRCLITALAGAAFVTSAAAQIELPRNFPADALRGDLTVGMPPEVMLNGRPAQLSPGVRIRAQNNLIEMSGNLAGQRLLVHYTLDMNGMLKDVWVLRPEEAAKRPWPATPKEAQTWVFDPIAQAWSKP